MQDKNKRTLDPALMDNAWLQMKQQLDQEMPQKKRRAIWWWAGLAGLAILTLSAYLLATNAAPRPLEAESVAVPEVIVADKTSDQESTISHEEPTNSFIDGDHTATAALAGNSKLSEREMMGTNLPAAIPFFQKAPIDEKEAAVESKIKRPAGASPSPEMVAQDQADDIVLDKIPSPENEGSTPPVETRGPGVAAQARTAALAIDQLPPIISDLLPIPRDPTSDLKLPVKVSEVKPIGPWHYYLEGQGGLSLAQTDYNNFAVGLGVQRDIHNKWSAELGLQYQRNQRTRKNMDSELAEEFLGSAGSGFAVERTLAFQNIETARWNIYLGGVYQLSPRFSLGLGAQGSYIAKAFTVFDNASGLVTEPTTAYSNDLRVDLYNGALSVYDIDTETNSVSNPYPLDANRWQWSLNSTARYRFGQRWEALVQYQRHLMGWPSREESFGGLSTLQAGVRCYLR